MIRLSFPFLIVLLLISCQGTERDDVKVDLLIENVHIVDVSEDKVIPDQWIAIISDTIVKTGSMQANFAGTSKTVIDGLGGYIMPGLWDNHVHFRGGDELIEENKDLIPLYNRFGVVAVRDAGGDITQAVKLWQKQIENGEMIGPSIFTSGPKIDGKKPAWEGSLSVTNSQEVSLALDSLESIGVDYVKTYDGSLTEEMYYEVINQASARGLKVTGHMPLTANLQKAIALGLAGSEHMYYLLKACSSQEDSLTRVGGGYGMMPDLLSTYDKQKAAELFANLAANNVFTTPTLHIGAVLGNLATEDHSEDKWLDYIGPGVQKTYQRRLLAAKRNTSTLSQQRNFLRERFIKMVKPLHDAGAPILAGSDCGPFNSFVYPGHSIHQELVELVNAGLTPAQALATSVINGPKFLGLEDRYCMVDTGRKADLLILKETHWKVLKPPKVYSG